MEKNLKRGLWLLMMILFVSTSFTSCKDDDDDKDKGNSSQLVGTWVDEDDSDYKLVFESNGRGREIYDYESYSFTWSATGNILTIRFDDEDYEDEPWTGQYRLSSDGKTLYFDDYYVFIKR